MGFLRFSSFSNGNLHQQLVKLKKAAWPPKLASDVTSLFRCAATCLTGGFGHFCRPNKRHLGHLTESAASIHDTRHSRDSTPQLQLDDEKTGHLLRCCRCSTLSDNASAKPEYVCVSLSPPGSRFSSHQSPSLRLWGNLDSRRLFMDCSAATRIC